MLINKKWAMPNGNTFKIKPIKELILKYIKENDVILDPFANEPSIQNFIPSSCKYISNDLNEKYNTTYHMEATELFKQIEDNSIDVVLYDPPYSPNQVKVCYEELEKTVTVNETRISYWTNFKKEIARVLKPNGICISCMWNTNGIGKNNGFEQIEILIVSHGSMHNDTLCVVEKNNTKVSNSK